MAWERRKRGSWYYTRSRRVGGRVVRDYLGCGLLGQLAAENDEEARQVRREEREGPLAVEAALATLSPALDALLVSTLEGAGYHRHKGEWRRRRSQ